MLATHVPRNMAARNTALVVAMIIRTASKILWFSGKEGEKEEEREGGREEGTKEVRRDEELIFKDFAIHPDRNTAYIYTCTSYAGTHQLQRHK